MKSQLDREITQLQIVTAAMMAGIITFGVVVLAIGSNVAQNDAQLREILLAVLCVLAAGQLFVYLVLRSVILAAAGRRFERERAGDDAEAQLLPPWRTLTLVRSAMVEGLGLFGLVIVLVTGTQVAFVAPVIALIVLAGGFPTRSRLTQLTVSVAGRNPFAR